MSIPRLTFATDISDRLNELAAKVKTRSRASMTDGNQVIETILCRFLNAFFGWQLVNLNSESKNFPAVDLGDRNTGVAVQITNELSTEKIIITAIKAKEHGLDAEFGRIIVFFLLPKKPTFPKDRDLPKMSSKIEAWDIGDILEAAKVIENFDRLQRASEILEEELGKVGLRTESNETRTTGEMHRFDHSAYGLSKVVSDQLYTSFFQVTFPSTIHRAKIVLKRGVRFDEWLRSTWGETETHTPPPVDYLTENGVLFKFGGFESLIWKTAVARRAIQVLEPFESGCWANSAKFSDRNLFIKLLRRNLEQLCNNVGTVYKLRWSKEMKCFLFQAEIGKGCGKIKVPALTKCGTREVFRAIKNTLPDRKGEIQHWKHQAFRDTFVRFGEEWFINVVPFWAFTSDGTTSQSRWHASSSRNMRIPERNRAVLGHVMFWAALLCKEPDMLKQSSSIRILRPRQLPVTPAILDDEWKMIAPDDEKALLSSDGTEELPI